MSLFESLLVERRQAMSSFWLGTAGGPGPGERGAGLRIGIRNYGDDFVFMLAVMIRQLGHEVGVMDRVEEGAEVDLWVYGPGPGDPTDRDDPDVQAVHDDLGRAVERDAPFLAVCLSHQILASRMGLAVRRLEVPHQGRQRTVDFFGEPATLAFYNSFSAFAGEEAPPSVRRMSVDAATGEVLALRGTRYESYQFHPESVLSTDGLWIIDQALTRLGSQVQGIRSGSPLNSPRADRDDMESEIAALVGGLLFGSSESLAPQTPLVEAGGLSSINMIELVGHIESRFGVTIPPEELYGAHFHSARSLAAYVAQASTKDV